ncbi:hypothetical protein E3E23_00580 [Thermococcus sp. CX2]|uniref:hypothetical protein n=1 Tax=Thermococcus sp. CX2 TaxID=163006 RepID=UPI001438A5B5|nr:hypothetical protein [Thermococcus sp. CX2]NJE84343.1 hypothetical protein [Thermococcus sp. CX2]
MRDPVSEFVDAFRDVLIGAVLGIMFSVFYKVALQLGMSTALIVSVSAMADIAGILSLTQESLKIPLAYLVMRIFGYIFAISILKDSGLPIAPAIMNLAILVVALILRVYYMRQG